MSKGSEPTFSICIPNYNYGRYIGETIQSVLDQTYQNFEIIVADNASTDNSVEVVESFKDKRIRLYKNRHNIGFAPNLQRATMFAQNQYINLLSSDDQMKPDALESYAKVLMDLGDRANQAVLFSQVEAFDEENRITSITRKALDGFYNLCTPGVENLVGVGDQNALNYTVYEGLEVLRDSLSRLRPFAPFLSIVYPRALWESIEGYNSVRTIGPDKHFNYKLLSLDPPVVYVPRILYRYRDFMSDNRLAQTTTLKQPIDDYLYTIEYSKEFLNRVGVGREKIIRSFVEETCLKEGLRQIGHRYYGQAFRLLCFALASYPGATMRLPKAYVLAVLLGLGPLAILLGPVMFKLYKMLTPDPELASSPASR